MTLDHLAELDAPCRECVFWELDPVRRERAVQAGEAAQEKEAWISQVLLEWGSCGRIAYVDGDPAGFVVYAPPAVVPGARSFPTAPASEDSVLLVTGMVYPEYGHGGLGRTVVQAVAKDLLKRGGIRAIEAFADTRSIDVGYGGCLLPADFLLRVGFKTHRQHPRHPRMRLELRSLLTWREEVEAAREKLVGGLRPERPAAEHVPRQQ
jgi:hypothetical protein